MRETEKACKIMRGGRFYRGTGGKTMILDVKSVSPIIELFFDTPMIAQTRITL